MWANMVIWVDFHYKMGYMADYMETRRLIAFHVVELVVLNSDTTLACICVTIWL